MIERVRDGPGFRRQDMEQLPLFAGLQVAIAQRDVLVVDEVAHPLRHMVHHHRRRDLIGIDEHRAEQDEDEEHGRNRGHVRADNALDRLMDPGQDPATFGNLLALSEQCEKQHDGQL